jgi:hypothetical protein
VSKALAIAFVAAVIAGCGSGRASEKARAAVGPAPSAASPAIDGEGDCTTLHVRAPDFDSMKAEDPKHRVPLPGFGMSVIWRATVSQDQGAVLLRDDRSGRTVQLADDPHHRGWLVEHRLIGPEPSSYGWLLRYAEEPDPCGEGLNAYDPRTLKRKWIYSTTGYWIYSTLRSGDHLILDMLPSAPGAPRRLVALDLASGRPAWTMSIEYNGSPSLFESIGGSLVARWGARDGFHVLVVDPVSGNVVFSHASPRNAQRFVVEGPQHIYETTGKGGTRLVSIDLRTGRPMWTIERYRKNEGLEAPNGACCAGSFVTDERIVVEDVGPPLRLRSFDLETGREHWSLELPKLVELSRASLHRRYWLLTDAQRPSERAEDPSAIVRAGYTVVDSENGRLMASLELAFRGSTDFPSYAADEHAAFFEIPLPGGRVGKRARTEAYAMPSGKRLWQGPVSQCDDYGESMFFPSGERLYACECDRVLRVYDRQGVVQASYGMKDCAVFSVENGELTEDGAPIPPSVFSEPARALEVTGTIRADPKAFSGWVQVGEKLVRADEHGTYTARVTARGWVLVQPKPPLGIEPEEVERYVVPPTVRKAFVPTLYAGWVH